MASGWSARRPMSWIFERGRVGVVLNARTVARVAFGRLRVRNAMLYCVFAVDKLFLGPVFSLMAMGSGVAELYRCENPSEASPSMSIWGSCYTPPNSLEQALQRCGQVVLYRDLRGAPLCPL